MKRIALAAAIMLFVLVFVGIPACGQENTATITVRGSEVVTGVVLVSGQLTSATGKRTSVELQCNKGVSQCVAPPAGTYVIVRLPKNRGTYDCANVELYPNGADPGSSEKIGAYCLNEK